MIGTEKTPREQFRKDSADFLSAMNGALLSLEKNPDDQEIVNEVFRLIHSLKSEASYLGFDDIAERAHDLESFFENVRSGGVALAPDDFDTLFPAVDELEDLVGKRDLDRDDEAGASGAAGGNEAGNEPGGIEMTDEVPVTEAPKVKSGNEPVSIGFTPFEKKLLTEARNRGERLYRLVCDIDPEAHMKFAKAYLVVNNLEQIVNVIRIDPPLRNGVEVARLDICFTSKVEEKTIYRAITLDQIEKIQLLSLEYSTFLGSGETVPHSHKRETRGDILLHVEMNKIDNLLRDVDELKYLVHSMRIRRDQSSLDDGLTRLAEISRSLGESAREMRVVRIGDELSRLHRLVRDLSRKLGKEGVLDIIGGNVEIDRGIIDVLFDPIVHLVRNAMDHGIEPPRERERCGKPRTGTHTIRTENDQGNLVVSIEDDGSGIDEEEILERGRLLGLKDAADRRDILAILSHPGFSTKTEATPLSGRGVGLDLVSKRIGQISGGSFSFSNHPGGGCVFTITIPASSLTSVTLIRYGTLTVGVPGRSIDGVEEAESVNFARDDDGRLFYRSLPVFSIYGRVAVSDTLPSEPYLVRLRVGSVSGYLLAEELLFEREVPEQEFVIGEEVKPYLYNLEIGGKRGEYLLLNPSLIGLR